MKFSQERFEESKKYDDFFYEAIYERLPNTIKITSLEGVKDNNGEFGARDIITLNDYIYNVDVVAISDNSKVTNFQFKTTSTSSVYFDLVSFPYSKYKYIKGSHMNEEDRRLYFVECGNADIIAFYLVNYKKLYFFNTDTVKNIFRFDKIWQFGSIQRGDNGCSYIRVQLDDFLNLYEEYNSFVLSGSNIEEQTLS